jgi:hypothetical protein
MNFATVYYKVLVDNSDFTHKRAIETSYSCESLVMHVNLLRATFQRARYGFGQILPCHGNSPKCNDMIFESVHFSKIVINILYSQYEL